MTFGEKIQKCRKEKGLSQEELAEQLNVTRQTISKWELDQSTPDLNYIVDMSNLFEVTSDYLIRNDVTDKSFGAKEPQASQAASDAKAPNTEKSSADFPADFAGAMPSGRVSKSNAQPFNYGGSSFNYSGSGTAPTGSYSSPSYTAPAAASDGGKKKMTTGKIIAIFVCVFVVFLFVFNVVVPLSAAVKNKKTEQAETNQVQTTEDYAAVGAIDWSEAKNHIGETVTVYGPVVRTKYASSSKGGPTFLDIGLSHPDTNRMDVIIYAESRGNFSGAPENMYSGKTIFVTGKVKLYDGVPEIIVSSESQIQIAS